MINTPDELENHTQDGKGNDPSGSSVGHNYDMNIPDTPYSPETSPGEMPSQPGQQPTPEIQVPRENEVSNPGQDDASYPSQTEITPPRENDAPTPGL